MTLAEFKALIDECATPAQVHGVHHFYYRRLVGTAAEYLEANDYADARQLELLGLPGGAIADRQ